MKNSEKNQNAPDILADFDDEVTARIENGPAAAEEVPVPEPSVSEAAPADSAPVEIEEVPAAEPLPETSEPAAETPTTEPVVEERPEPQYGAPQPLFEDIIPAGFAIDEEKRKAAEERAARVAAEAAEREAKEAEAARKREEKEAEAARKKAEKEAAKEAKLQAKEDKKRAKTAALIARVEAEAEQKAKREIEKETGEPYELPSAKPEAPAEAPVLAAVVPVPEAPLEELPATEEAAPEAVAAPAAPAAQPESATAPADAKPETPVAPARKYSSYERRLRRKYKIDKDPLLKENDVVPGFVIAKGEHVIRSYDCLASSKGDGILCLTNKRLLINAGERSEIGIDKVSGIKFSKYSRLSFLKFIFWLFFFGLGAFMVALPFVQSGMNIPFITGDSWKEWFTYLFYGCGGVSVVISIPLFFSMLKKTFYFYVYAREESPFLEYKSRAYAKREKKGKVYKYTITKAGRESEKAARELGALIIEAKEGRYDD